MSASSACLRRGERRRLAEQHRIDRQQPPRLLIGGAAHHDAVDVREMLARLPRVGDAAIDRRSADRGCARLQPVDAVVVERRDIAVLARRQALRARPCGHARSARRRRPRSTASVNVSSAASGSCSSMPMRHFTVTGIVTAAFIAATQSPTSAGSAIRQAPKRPSCTRSDGQPTLRLISS